MRRTDAGARVNQAELLQKICEVIRRLTISLSEKMKTQNTEGDQVFWNNYLKAAVVMGARDIRGFYSLFKFLADSNHPTAIDIKNELKNKLSFDVVQHVAINRQGEGQVDFVTQMKRSQGRGGLIPPMRIPSESLRCAPDINKDDIGPGLESGGTSPISDVKPGSESPKTPVILGH